MKRSISNPTHWLLGSAAFTAIAWLFFVNLVPSEIVGPEPEGGFDETFADYDVQQYPDAPMVPVPLIDLEQMSDLPFTISFPEMSPGRDMAIVGEIIHPNTTVVGALVDLRFHERPRAGETEGRRRGGLLGFAKGEGGHLEYHIEGQTPDQPGTYDVRVALDHAILEEDLEQFPVEERTTTTLVAEGQIVITN